MIEVQFGEWLPDQADLNNPGLYRCEGVYPEAGYYAPFWGPDTGTAIGTGSGRPMGGAVFERRNGDEVICIATESHLGTMISGTSVFTALPGSNNADDATEYTWVFERFNQYVFATSREGGGTYHLANIETDDTFVIASGLPAANAIGFGDDFLFFGDIKDGGVNYPYRYQWSPYNNPLGTYGTDIATQAGFANAPAQFGPITGISGGEITLLFQKYGVSRLDADGSVTVFNRTTISQDRGCVAPSSIAKIGQVRYWLGHDGFYMSDGATVESISSSRVWSWFLEHVNADKLHKVQQAVNRDRRCIVWNFFSRGSTDFDRQIIYNYEQNRWSNAQEDYDWLVPVTFVRTIAEGDPVKNRIIAASTGSTSVSLYYLYGDAVEVFMETGDTQLIPGQYTFVREIYPLVENTSSNTAVSIGTRLKPQSSVSYSTEVTEGPHGYCATAVSGRFVRTRLRIPTAAVWDKFQGFQVEAMPVGPA